jgi:predicted DNA-binding protein (MmcQ/YjbR family)
MCGRLAVRCSRSAVGTKPSPAFTFKVSPLSFEILKALPGLRPAPYLGIQHYAEPGLGDVALCDYLTESHRLVALGLSAKRRRELGLE